MRFNFTKRHLTPPEQSVQRLFEILPGLTSWCILIGMTVLAFVKPIIAAVFIIAFDLYWFLRLIYMTIFLSLSYWRLSIEEKTDWMHRVHEIDAPAHAVQTSYISHEKKGFYEWLSQALYKKEMRMLTRSKNPPPPLKDIHHVVIFAIAKEPWNVIEPSIKSITSQHFPCERIAVFFALEETASDQTKKAVHTIANKYKDYFMTTRVITHPSDRPEEARVKGANITYTAQEVAPYFQKKNIPFENIIVSCFDADTIVSEEYFPCLTYCFMIHPERTQASYQPIPVYHNNIWEVPGFARVIETGSSFFQLIEATNPEKLVTFSSHSMSFKALVEVGYWPVDMISDDSAIFWKSLIHYDGHYRVVPMYVTLSMDVASSDTLWKTAKSVYTQKRRWAWGVENFPIVMRAFLTHNTISLFQRFRYAFKLFEGHVSWATWGFILTIIGWLPALLARKDYVHSVAYYNVPHITGTIFNLASLSLLICIFLSIQLLPKKKVTHSLLRKIKHAFEWLMIPLILLVFSSLAALDAQTRLLFGKQMEFSVTEKKRKG